MNNSNLPNDNCITFTRVKSTNPKELRKRYSVENGKVVKTAIANMITGKARTETVNDLAALSTVIDSIQKDEALLSGVFPKERCHIACKSMAQPEKDVFSRSLDHVAIAEDACYLQVLDNDPHKDGVTFKSAQEAIDYVCSLSPEFEQLEILARPSSSAGIQLDGEEIKKAVSWHLFIRVMPNVSPSALADYIKALCWQRGDGYIALSKIGAKLERCTFDLAVFSPERLIFEAKPKLENGLTRKEYATAHKQGRAFCIDDLKDIDQSQVELLIAQAKADIDPEAKNVCESYQAEKIQELVASGMNKETAERAISNLSKQQLTLDAFVVLSDNTQISVRELCEHHKLYDLQSMADPIEGRSYGTTTAKFFWNDGRPVINSMAHGGIVYKIVESYTPTHTPPQTQEKANSDPFGLCEIDITKPHGILGDMCEAMNASAHRMLAEAYPLYGLQTLAMVAMVAGIRSFTGSKLNLITLLIAPTASGKENGQAFFDDVAAQLKLSKYTFNKPRSDKDLITNMVETEGMCSYSIDEAHSLFDSMQNKNAQSYQLAMGAEMLTMATKNNYVLSGNHRREFRSQYETRLARLEGALEKLEGDDKEAQQKKRNFEEKIKHYERTLEAIENGFKHPLINMAMASTPEKIDKVVSSETIESGLMGRSLVIRADEDRAELNLYPSPTLCRLQTIEALNNAMDRSGNVSISAEARELYEKVVIHYDRTMRNHSTLGGLYARIGDRATAIASLLAVTSGEVTEDDMRFAFALCLRHIEDCRFLLVKADAVESGDYDGQVLEVKERILKFCSKMGTARGQLCQKVTKPKGIAKMMREAATRGKPSIYDDALNQLITDNMISMDGNRFIKL